VTVVERGTLHRRHEWGDAVACQRPVQEKCGALWRAAEMSDGLRVDDDLGEWHEPGQPERGEFQVVQMKEIDPWPRIATV
jgi:hypothetical protein